MVVLPTPLSEINNHFSALFFIKLQTCMTEFVDINNSKGIARIIPLHISRSLYFALNQISFKAASVPYCRKNVNCMDICVESEAAHSRFDAEDVVVGGAHRYPQLLPP